MLAVTTGAAAVLAGGLGLLLGSFLNVVAYRLPRHESLVAPASRCPGCEAPIKPYDNVPVLSWLLLRGRCRACGTSIAWRYPLVELCTGLLLALVVIVVGTDSKELWLALAFTLLLVPVTVIDLDFRIIPNTLMIVGTATALALLVAFDASAIPEHLIAAFAAGGFLLAAVLVHPRGMGLGDVKLAFVMGLFLGQEVGVAMFVALVTGSVVGIGVMAVKGAKEGRKTAIPFGPFLALGSYVALLAGEPVVDWYLNTFA
jgi:leader peptidase (prepilin peptidase) / N-methyltransferase